MPNPPTLILFAHGSRNPEWATPLVRLRDTLRHRRGGEVVLAYAELQGPSLLEAARDLAGAGVEDCVVVPIFFGPGRHVQVDLPDQVAAAMAELPGLKIRVTGTIGEEPLVLAGLADGIAAAAARQKNQV